jgi:transcriptional regulator with GAF, ATPase, and Fis domain
MDDLGKWLVPPHFQAPGNEFAKAVQRVTKASAVSFFLVSPEDPNRLEFAGGVGYTDEYRQVRYLIDDEEALTAYVAREGKPVHYSRRELAKHKNRVPFSGRCDRFLLDKKGLLNIVAVPLMFEGNCLGVLKLENVTQQDVRPHDDDFEFAQVLASIVALAYQQRLYSALWEEVERAGSESKTRDDYLKRIVRILAFRLSAECASVFLKMQSNGRTVLRYAAGVGYDEEKVVKEYDYEDPNALTVYVARSKVPLRANREELERLKRINRIPFSNRCEESILSRRFQNILAFPLQRQIGDEVLGVLKVENKAKADPGKNDEDVVRAFVEREIAGTLLAFAARDTKRASTGVQLLRQQLGPPPSRPDRAFMDKLRSLHDDKRLQITGDDCAEYLGCTRATYHRWRGAPPGEPADSVRK